MTYSLGKFLTPLGFWGAGLGQWDHLLASPQGLMFLRKLVSCVGPLPQPAIRMVLRVTSMSVKLLFLWP